MAARVRFRLDRKVPASISGYGRSKENVAVDLFDAKRLEELLAQLEALEAVIVSAVSIELDSHFVHERDEPDPDWVAAVVVSDNHEWLADESYIYPFDWSKQRVPLEQPLRVYTTPEGKFSAFGYQFGAKASFRKFVDAMPESFDYATGEVIRKGKVLGSWSRVEPLQEVELLSADSLGSLSTSFHPRPFRSHNLWMGSRLSEDFGFVWDALRHGWFEEEKCALVPVSTARKLSERFPGDFLAEPVFDRESKTAVRAVEVFQTVRERLPMQGWS